jgi:hypothetical protein
VECQDPTFSSEYNTLLNSIDNIRRRINATREISSNDPELKGCAFSNALEHCDQRLRTIYIKRCEAVRAALRDKASRELEAAAPRDLARPSKTTPSPDVCDTVNRVLLSSLRSSSLEDNHQRRVARGGSIERAVSWKGNLEAVRIIPGRHSDQQDADVQWSTFTKRGNELVRTLRKFGSKLLVATTTISNVKTSSESAAASFVSVAKLAMEDSRRHKNVC